ncbi:MAG: histidine phosphatase family protein [Candidatus Falkowbacteria bacterium]
MKPNHLKRLYVIRHGEDNDNKKNILNGRKNTRLSLRGTKQAKEAAASLLGIGINLILTSPLQRCGQTARIIAEKIKSEIHREDALIERDFGVLTGKSKKDIIIYARRTVQIGDITYFLNAPGCETFPRTYRRAEKFLKSIDEKYQGRNILLVTHGDIGKMIIGAAQNLGWRKSLYLPNLKNAAILKIRVD